MREEEPREKKIKNQREKESRACHAPFMFSYSQCVHATHRVFFQPFSKNKNVISPHVLLFKYLFKWFSYLKFFFHMDMLISYMDELILYVDIYVNWLWNLYYKKLFFTSFFQKCKVIFIFKACFLFSYQMIDLLAIWYLNRSYYSNVEILLFLYNKK